MRCRMSDPMTKQIATRIPEALFDRIERTRASLGIGIVRAEQGAVVRAAIERGLDAIDAQIGAVAKPPAAKATARTVDPKRAAKNERDTKRRQNERAIAHGEPVPHPELIGSRPSPAVRHEAVSSPEIEV